ncbi:hypothetical protein DFJ77DRAFT_446289 [Powellomyces hirtus]|nr:hypothetical protein DFJ77DRAFT_446289 [Powellomyces hirtus]
MADYGNVHDAPAVPLNSDDPRKQVQGGGDRGFNLGGHEFTNQQLGIAGGILGTATAIGLGAFAYDKYNDSKEQAAEDEWGFKNWEADAHRRQGEYLEAVKANKDLPKLTWVLTDANNIPQGAIRGGQESDGTPLYIARAFHEQGVHIGTASANFKDGAHIAYNGKQIEVPKYEILLGYESAVRWVDGQGPLKNLVGKPVEGGREPDGTPIYIGQGHLKNSVRPGKVGANYDGCLIAYDNDEEKERNYRYLVYAQ